MSTYEPLTIPHRQNSFSRSSSLQDFYHNFPSSFHLYQELLNALQSAITFCQCNISQRALPLLKRKQTAMMLSQLAFTHPAVARHHALPHSLHSSSSQGSIHTITESDAEKNQTVSDPTHGNRYSRRKSESIHRGSCHAQDLFGAERACGEFDLMGDAFL